MIAFSTVLLQETLQNSYRDPCMMVALEDVKTRLNCAKALNIQEIMFSKLLAPVPVHRCNHDVSFRSRSFPDISLVFQYNTTTSLLLALLLDAPTIKLAVKLPEVSQKAHSVITASCSVLSWVSQFTNWVRKVFVVSVVIATLVPPVMLSPEGNHFKIGLYSLLTATVSSRYSDYTSQREGGSGDFGNGTKILGRSGGIFRWDAQTGVFILEKHYARH